MKQPFVRKLPQDLTSYDFLKTWAVLTMIIDHVGFYFFPDQIGWRIVGRTSMPVWLFLIGYAQTRDLLPILWASGAALLIGNIVVGMPLFSLNILFTIAIVRLLLDGIMRISLSNLQSMAMMVLTMAILAFPSMFIVEYGTVAMLFAMFGYLVRHQKKLGLSNENVLIFMAAAFLVYIMVQRLISGVNDIEFYTMSAGILMVCLVLSAFEAKLYPDLTRKLPNIIVWPLKLMGRRTLEIYVIHLLLFKALGLALFSERFSLFQWSLF